MENRKIVFLGGIFDKNNSNSIAENSIGIVQNAADALQKSFIKGLKHFYKDTKVLNMPFLGSYPNLYKKANIKFEDSEIFTAPVINIPFNNIKGYKMFSRFFNMLKAIYGMNDVIFIIYSINMPFLLAAYLSKIFGKGNRIILIVPDLPEFMNQHVSAFKSFLLKIQDLILDFIIFKRVDGFVLLTEAMNERLKVPIDKVVVVEGMFINSNINILTEKSINDSAFKVLYTGTLDERYGIIDLIDQFSLIKDNSIELIICGGGDELSINKIINKTIEDTRVKFKGQLLRDDILKMQQEVCLLINPRKPEEFTKFSFPSKTMEYFASGTPVLMYKLAGIPDEYYKYCFMLDDSNINTICEEIIRIKKITLEERLRIGQEAKTFVLEHKNEIQQVGKVKKLVDKIFL